MFVGKEASLGTFAVVVRLPVKLVLRELLRTAADVRSEEFHEGEFDEDVGQKKERIAGHFVWQ